MTTPKSHRSRGDRRTAALDDAVRAALGEHAQRLPQFDPADAGVRAEVLLLLKSPGSGAANRGIVSLDTGDAPAERLREAVERAGLSRSTLAVWNVIPWPLDRPNRSLRVAELDRAFPALRAVIDRLPRLRAVVLMGGATHRAWERFERSECFPRRDLRVTHACSPRAQGRSRERVVASLTQAIRAAM